MVDSGQHSPLPIRIPRQEGRHLGRSFSPLLVFGVRERRGEWSEDGMFAMQGNWPNTKLRVPRDRKVLQDCYMNA